MYPKPILRYLDNSVAQKKPNDAKNINLPGFARDFAPDFKRNNGFILLMTAYNPRAVAGRVSGESQKPQNRTKFRQKP